MFSKINRFLLIILLFSFSLSAFSQEEENDDGDAPLDNPPVPINDSIQYLIIAGALYGAYTFEKKKISIQASK